MNPRRAELFLLSARYSWTCFANRGPVPIPLYGLHGVLAPQVLGFRARPVMLYDLDGKEEPLGALHLGGNADLYVLHDPCAEIVQFVPVGSSRVELVDQVTCRPP